MATPLVTLKFTNRWPVDQGGPVDVVQMEISREAVPHVMEWYGAFFAGDDYDVHMNGRKLRIGINGEFEMPTLEAKPRRFAISKT
jgi:hypothetical protein